LAPHWWVCVGGDNPLTAHSSLQRAAYFALYTTVDSCIGIDGGVR